MSLFIKSGLSIITRTTLALGRRRSWRLASVYYGHATFSVVVSGDARRHEMKLSSVGGLASACYCCQLHLLVITCHRRVLRSNFSVGEQEEVSPFEIAVKPQPISCIESLDASLLQLGDGGLLWTLNFMVHFSLCFQAPTSTWHPGRTASLVTTA